MKNVNHIARDTSYFVTRSGKKNQDNEEDEPSDSEKELPVKVPQPIKSNPIISIPAPISDIETPVVQPVRNNPKIVQELPPKINPVLTPKTMSNSPIKIIPNKRKQARTMRLAQGMQPYDLLANLDNIQPTISMRQLLAIAPKCRSELSYSLIRKRSKEINVHDISIDPGAPTVNVMIDGSLIQGVQIDGGSSVNLMNRETMDEIGLTNMIATPLILRMADQSKVKPLGLLKQVPTLVGEIEYEIDYIIFKVTESISSYPILLGRPWLYLAKAKDDWGKGTLTIGKGSQKTSLPMYPPIYRGETQEEDTNVTFDNSYDSDSEGEMYEPVKHVASNPTSYTRLGPGEYFTPLEDPNDSDDAILAWQQSVCNISVQDGSELEPECESDSKELEELLMDDDPTPLKMGTLKTAYKEMNLGTEEDPKNINVYEGLTPEEFTMWYQFFKSNKSAFAWTYKDLKGVPPKICEHQIILEDNAKPVQQRPYRLNPKYSALVHKEIKKLLECGFIYPIPYSEWVSPIVIVPKKNGKIRICQDYRKLNNVTKKDHFPLPFTDTLLDIVAGHEMYSLMDGFSGYNQIGISKAHQLLTAFITDEGVYAHNKMPFGLCNAPATYQRLVITVFMEYLHKFMESFLDDFCVFSSKAKHADCLEKCFQKCHEYGISLNAAKSQFLVPYGKLLGHIVSVQGMATDPYKVAAIANLPIPNTVSEVKGFLGHAGYYRRYIYKYATIALPLTQLLKKSELPPVWTPNCTKAFET